MKPPPAPISVPKAPTPTPIAASKTAVSVENAMRWNLAAVRTREIRRALQARPDHAGQFQPFNRG
jgi:hypothetical protein